MLSKLFILPRLGNLKHHSGLKTGKKYTKTNLYSFWIAELNMYLCWIAELNMYSCWIVEFNGNILESHNVQDCIFPPV